MKEDVLKSKIENVLKNKIYYQTDLGLLLCGDAIEILQFLPDESVDLVIADPPYNSQSIAWDKKNNEWQLLWLEEIRRIMKKGASLYMFFAPLNMHEIEGWIRKHLTLKNLIVWFHPNLYGAGMKYSNDRWKSTWDVIFYAVKGKKAKHNKKVAEEGWKLNPRGGGFDVMIYPQPRPLYHKAQKPLELIMKIILCSSNENDLVLDPFLGSGTTAIACEKLNRNWIGIEINENFCKLAKKRIINETQTLMLNSPPKPFPKPKPASKILFDFKI